MPRDPENQSHFNYIKHNYSLLADIIQWDIKNWSRSLDFWQSNTKRLSNPAKMNAVDLGARNGGISLFLALQEVNTICSDLTNPEVMAKPLHQRYGLEKLIEYASIDILDINSSDKNFDIVVFKSVLGDLGAAEKQVRAIREILRILKPGGECWFAENLKASFIHQFFRKYFIRWGKQWRYLERDEFIDMLQQAGFKEIKYHCYGFWAVFGRNEWQRRLLSYLDRLTDRLIPDKSKYIIFGIAVK